MKLKKAVLCAGIAVALGVSGSVSAGFGPVLNINLLDNPGFEAALGDEWTENDAVRDDNEAHTGTWSARMYEFDGDEGNMYQDVDVTGCSPYGKGEYAVAGWHGIADGSDDVALLTVEFDGNPAWDYDDDTPGGWNEIQHVDNIPADATTATVTILGADAVDGDDTAEVWWDDIHFGTDCVTDFMKASGKIQGSEESPRGQYSVGGVFYNLESDPDGADAQGSMFVNYKSDGFSCEFTAEEDGGDIEYETEGTPPPPDGYDYACVETTYECEGTDAPDPGSAVVCITLGAGGAEGTGKDKDRGEFCVYDGSDSAVNISDAFIGSSFCADLDKGNTDLMMPES